MAAGGGKPEVVSLDTVRLGEGDYILSDGLEPPHYAYVHVSGPDRELTVSAAGPFSRKRLDFEFSGEFTEDAEPTVEEVEMRKALAEAEVYDVAGFDLVGIDGSYPGGRERIIQNAARFILGTE